MEINGWGIGLIALYLVGKYGFRVFLVTRIGGAGRKLKNMIPGGKTHDVEV